MTLSEDGSLAGRTAIAGIGATEFSKESGRSELRLAVEAILDALGDAGLGVQDVEGLVTFALDNNDEIEVAKSLGIKELTFFARTPYGGGPCCTTVQLAAMAIATSAAGVVVCYRALNERSGRRFGQPSLLPLTRHAWYNPFGLATPASRVALLARRYMHETGATSEDFGRVSVVCRRHGATNPKAWFYGRRITLEEHQASPWVVEPLRRLDCCQESDAAVAIVVTCLERARSLRQPPAVIRAAASGSALGRRR
jgi:acetyl-CoA acetyltransferase